MTPSLTFPWLQLWFHIKSLKTTDWVTWPKQTTTEGAEECPSTLPWHQVATTPRDHVGAAPGGPRFPDTMLPWPHVAMTPVDQVATTPGDEDQGAKTSGCHDDRRRGKGCRAAVLEWRLERRGARVSPHTWGSWGRRASGPGAGTRRRPRPHAAPHTSGWTGPSAGGQHTPRALTNSTVKKQCTDSNSSNSTLTL